MDNGRVSDETSADADADTGRPAPQEPLPPRRAWILAIVAPVLLAADLLTKQLALSALEGEQPVRVLGGLFYLQIVRNPGAAFGMATGMTWVLTLVALAVVGGIVWVIPKLRSVGWAIGLSLVLAGAVGNLLDRFFRAPGAMHGHVVDFLSPFAPNGDVFPVFNVADSSIVCGGALIVLMALLGRDYDGRRTAEKTAEKT
jgi:signal peptidase II